MPKYSKNDYVTLAAAVEQELKQHPFICKIKFGLWTLIGYPCIFCFYSLSVLLGGFVGAAGVSIVLNDSIENFIDLSNSLVAAAALYVLIYQNPLKHLNQPQGYLLTEQDCPQLFAELNQLNQKQKAPRIHNVLLEHSCNAAISIESRFLFLGCNKHTLIIGLELLLVTSPEQMRAVLAHEWAHLSGRNEQFQARVHIVLTHMRYFLAMLKKYNVEWLQDVFDRYLSILTIYSLTFRRANEFNADATAARLMGQKHMAEGLLQNCILGNWLNEYYWSPIFDLARIWPTPVASPYKYLQVFLQDAPVTPNELEARLKQSLSQKPGLFDSHPSWAERLAALQTAPAIPSPTQQSAAEAWLGERLGTVIADMDQDWQKQYLPVWQQRYQAHQESLININNPIPS